MHTQLDFVLKICSNYEYWTNLSVIQASIARYHKFMHLMKIKKNNILLVPTLDIDLAWHAHQTNPDQYRAYTRNVTGKLVDHDDSVGGADLNKGYANTFILWSEKFNEAYSSEVPDRKAWSRQYAVSNVLIPPLGVYRYLKWRKHTKTEGREISDLPPRASIVSTTSTSVSISSSADSVIYANPTSATPVVMATLMTDESDLKKGNIYSVIGTPVNDKRARPDDHPYYTTWYPIYYAPVGGCGGGCSVGAPAVGGCGTGGCAASGCASGGGKY